MSRLIRSALLVALLGAGAWLPSVGMLRPTVALAATESDLTLTGNSSTIYGRQIGSPGNYPAPGAGFTYSLATLSDPDGTAAADFQFTVAWGDGTTTTTCTTGSGCSPTDPSLNCGSASGCTLAACTVTPKPDGSRLE